MSKAKKLLGCTLVTVVIWTISRFIPAVVGTFYPDSTILKLFALIALLPVGWLAAGAISKGRFSRCIRVNLYFFALIEALGVLEIFVYLLQNLSLYTGQYTYDANGIAYSNYLIIFGGTILFEAGYIAACVYCAQKTVSTSGENVVVNPEVAAKKGGELPAIASDISGKQRYCKYCGGEIGRETGKCTKCGKQFLDIKLNRKKTEIAAIAVALVGLVTLNIYQYTEHQQDTAMFNSEVVELNSEIATLKEEIATLELTVSTRDKTISSLRTKISNLESKANNYDAICNQFRFGNVGYASYNFNADESVIVVRKTETNRKVTLTAHWSSGGTVEMSCSSDCADVEFDKETWSTSTTLTIIPKRAGINVVRFSNSVNNDSFKIIIIVIE